MSNFKKFLVALVCALLPVGLIAPAAQASDSIANIPNPSSKSIETAGGLTEKDGEVIRESIKVDESGEYYFDTLHAVNNGIPEGFASDLQESIEKYNAMSDEELNTVINEISSANNSSDGGASLLMTQAERRCLVTFATTAGVNLGSLVGVFLTGGWGAVVLLSGVAAANANVIADCYDDNGNPIL